MSDQATALVIAVDGTTWPVETQPHIHDLEDIYPLIGARRAEVLPVNPSLNRRPGPRLAAVLNGMALDFWYGRMSAYERPRNMAATVLAQALGADNAVLHGPVVLQAGNPETGDSLPLSAEALTLLQNEVGVITSIPEIVDGITESITAFHARGEDQS